jgi:hypothetical protein
LETLNRVIARSSDRAMANRFVCDRAIARWIDHAIARWIDHRSRDRAMEGAYRRMTELRR